MKKVFGSFLVIAGLLAIAGSAGDCDGACIEQANSLSEMLMAIFIGLVLGITGAVIALKD